MRVRPDPGWGTPVFRLAEVVALLTPLESAVNLPGLGSLPKLTTGLLIFVFVLAFARRRRFEDTRPFGAILFAHVGWLVLSSAWASDQLIARERMILLVQIALFGLVFCQVANSKRQRARLALAFGIGNVIGSVIVISNWLNNVSYLGYGIGVEATVDNTGEIARFTIGGEDPNHIATLLAVGAVFLYWGAWELFGRKGRLIALGGIALLAFGALLTGSRGSSVLAPTGVLAYIAWVRMRRQTVKFIGVAILAGLLGAAVWTVLPNSTRVRMSTSFDGNQSTSKIRLQIWTAGIHAWEKRPFHGVGIGAYPDAVREEISRAYVAHNTLINELVEQGLIGFAVTMAPLILIWRRSGKLPEAEMIRSRSVLLMYLIATMALSLELKKVTYFVLAMLAAEVRSIRMGAPFESASRRRIPLRRTPEPIDPILVGVSSN
jgi:O-antigen ligase